MCAHACMSLCALHATVAYRGQERTSNTLELELHTVGSCQVLGTEWRSSQEESAILNTEPSLQPPIFVVLKFMAMVSLRFQCRRILEVENNTVYCITNVTDVKTKEKLNVRDTKVKFLKTCD